MNMQKTIWKGFGVWLCLVLFSFSGLSQQTKLDQKIPVDPKVKIGKFDNGLTYYVRQNEKPEGKIELRLVVKAGSILEDDDQQGLAHFTEHMGFNGSKHFKENELVSFLQSMGVQFGADLNAYTSFDETVYILPIPLNNPENLEKAMLVLEDWAFHVAMEGKDIDDERGVVIEEWRIGRGAQQRMQDRFFPKLFANSRYADRLPIGKLEILQNFEHDAIRRFYKEWYRPNLMAVIAVGDYPVEQTEALIKKHFASQPNPEGARERKEFDIPGHKETLVAIETDPEAPFTQFSLYIKHPISPTETFGDLRNSIIAGMYTGMLNQRLNELTQKPNPPFLGAGVGYGQFLGPANVLSISGAVAPGEIIKGLKAALEENERVVRFGFTSTELDRYKKQYLNNEERAYNERDKVESGSYSSRYINHFLNNQPIPSQEVRYEFIKEVLPTISLEEVNKVAAQLFTDENRVLIIMGPEKEGLVYPSEQELLAVLRDVDQSQLTAYEDAAVADALISQLPTPGKIVSESKVDALDIYQFTLSNGVKVSLKSTNLKNDEILMSASKQAGTSILPDSDHLNATFAPTIISESGVAEFSKIELQKLLAGKTARVSPSLGLYSMGMSGSSTPKDFETMLQLAHLYFTKPRKDSDFFQSFMTIQKSQMATIMASPDFQFQDKLSKFLSQNHPRGGGFPSAEELEGLNHDRMMEIYKKMFSDADGFHFTFVGNIDPATAKPLIEQYLGSLPSTQSGLGIKNLGINPPSGKKEEVIRVGTDQKSTVLMLFSGSQDYSIEESLDIALLGEILTIKLIETLREEIGGVYGAGANGSLSRIPEERYSLQVSFPCSPDNVDKLVEATWKELNYLKANGPSAEDLAKVKETRMRQLEENRQRNSYWLGQIGSYVNQGLDLNLILDSEKRLQAVSAERIHQAAKKYINPDQYIKVVRLPVE
jgi:zinc protease